MSYHSRLSQRRLLLASVLMPLAAACSNDSRGIGSSVGPNESVTTRMTSENRRVHTGVDQTPKPLDERAFTESMRRHYPDKTKKVQRERAVLVDVDYDAQGVVRDVRVVNRPATPSGKGGVQTRAVLVDVDRKTGRRTEHPLDIQYDAAFGPAAEATLRETRFTPAMRDGRAVPYTERMTLVFGPSNTTGQR